MAPTPYQPDENNGGTVTSNPTASGTYTVAANGRVTVTGGAHPPVIYLVSQDKGFIVGTDHLGHHGVLRTSGGNELTNASFSGNYIFGDIGPVVRSSSLGSGVANANGTGTISGTSDDNSSGTLTAGQAFSATYYVSSNGPCSHNQ